MPNDCISFQNSGYFSKIIVDYLNQDKKLEKFYHRFPKLENFKLQIEEKQKNFSQENRFVLVENLLSQYKNFNMSFETFTNIKLLESNNTYTITTGHQLNLFTGPLYFLYKIVSTINLCKELRAEYPENNFVPVYWMATEDHDFEEINYFHYKGKKYIWNKSGKGPVGRLSTEELKDIYEIFSNDLGISQNAEYLKDLFRNAYLENSNLSDATRFIVNELFKKEGLVIVDADNKNLKKLFIPFLKEELLKQISYQEISETIENLKNYNIQVNPREINLFFITDNLRERIIFNNNNKFEVLNTNLSFTEDEILFEVEKNPEKFSPNVITRPLYQEVILPNLCYIGGGGELAYWIELKNYFNASKVTFPILLLRNSVLLCSKKQANRADKLEVTWNNLFLKQQDLYDLKTKELSNFTIDFSEQKELLQKQFLLLEDIAKQTDKSFIGAVKAQEKKQIKGLENLEKRLLKAEKRVHQEQLNRILNLQNELFPNQSLQERKVNFSEFFEEHGCHFIEKLLEDLKPLEQNFNIIILP